MKQGEEKQLSIKVIPENHTDSVILSSSSECVVVDEKGKVTAASAGTSDVSASSAHGNVLDECIIKVRDTQQNLVEVFHIVGCIAPVLSPKASSSSTIGIWNFSQECRVRRR